MSSEAIESGRDALLVAEDEAYSKGLKARHIQMIAVGGAIGTGLFLGAGSRLNIAGPFLAVLYALFVHQAYRCIAKGQETVVLLAQ